jgi:predicted dehydrogenase
MSTLLPPVRVGVIGFGQWGPNHVRNLSMMEGVEVRRVCDSAESRLQTARTLFRHALCTSNPRDILDAPDIDAVVIATPTSTHFPLVSAALQAGKDVLCEKPLAPTSAECRQLLALAAARQRILMVGHVFLYNAGILHLKADLDRQLLGKIYYMDAVRTNLGPVRTDVGTILDLASHDISIFNYLLGAHPVAVAATGRCVLQKGIEDVAFLTLHYPGDIVCHAHVSWLNPRKVRQLTIVGDSKMSVWDDMNNLEPIRYYDKGITASHYASFGEFHMILRDGQITIPKVHLSEPLMKQDTDFIACVRSRRAPVSDGQCALSVVLALETAMESLGAAGKLVPVPAL